MRFRDGLEDLQPYSIEEHSFKVKLDANEMPVNLPPTVAAVLSERLNSLHLNRYPEIAAHSLRTKLADSMGGKLSQVQIGNGSSELLQAVCYVFGGAGRKIVYPEPSFSMYPVYIRLADSQPVAVQLENDYSLSVEKYYELAKSADLAILCNPNNPTGNVMAIESIAWLAGKLSCPLLVDEAYFEFHKTSAVDLIRTYNNLIVVRTFSKAYGLAGARVGYMFASEAISSAVGKVLLPYHVNALSLTAAETVLDYQNEFIAGITTIINERERLSAALSRLPNIRSFPSQTNFLLVKVEEASPLAAQFNSAGIGIRDFSHSPGLKGCLRITVGTPAENDLVIANFEKNCRSRGDRR